MSGAGELRPDTVVVHAGRPAREPGGPLAAPIVLSSTYHAGGRRDTGATGTRRGTRSKRHSVCSRAARRSRSPPGWRPRRRCSSVFRSEPVWLLPRARTWACGPSSASGVRLPVSRSCSSTSPTPRVTLAAAEGATLLWLESPTNPLIGVADLPALIAGGHDRGAAVVVDNTFATAAPPVSARAKAQTRPSTR